MGTATVLAGATSWADRSLVRDGGFYPSRSLGAAQRLAYYASRLPLAEVATTFRFPPTPEVTSRWASATPPGFTLDVQAWSLLTGAPTWPESLWSDLQGRVTPSRREGAKLYRHRLPADVVDECWERFVHALKPLAQAGRMGAVVLRYPAWFSPRPDAWAELAEIPSRLPGLRAAVELTNDKWLAGDQCEQTLGFLEGVGLGFVCRDRPAPARPVVAATSDWAFVRFPGRHRGGPAQVVNGQGGPDGEGPAGGDGAAEGCRPAGGDGPAQGEGRADGAGPVWWSYRYSDAELAAWEPLVRDLASGTSQVHLVMDNCWRTDAVDNAARLLQLVGAGSAEPLPAGSSTGTAGTGKSPV